jgi:hypothetical protein
MPWANLLNAFLAHAGLVALGVAWIAVFIVLGQASHSSSKAATRFARAFPVLASLLLAPTFRLAGEWGELALMLILVMSMLMAYKQLAYRTRAPDPS